MNRIIKFRAWDTFGKTMLYSKVFNNESGKTVTSFMAFDVPTPNYSRMSYEQGYMGWAERDLSEPMQFTGLLDKNGKEVFEGDIVAWRPKVGSTVIASFDDDGTILRQVVWYADEARYCWQQLNGTRNGSGFTFCENNTDIFEVIGNIHENPELLK